ncbi:MAG TPA: amidase family protein [Pirellulales bacterium]|jgi:fatty acid amide hydrolase|nr:amidase family protein [Pirellulales bacterium]
MGSTQKQTDDDLLWLGAAEIARRVAAGGTSAAEITEAHIARIEAVNERLNAVVVKCFDRARREAAAIDRRRAAGEPLGPLAGVPVTIKECFEVAETPATLGLVRFRHELSTTDSPLVRRLSAAGAIVLGKTNVPQLMVLHETDNPLYGRTNNPWNLERSPGGSSGGEAAIIAAGGSVVGLGSDLGGSIRQPAHSVGICGLLPTQGRIELTGRRGNFYGLESLSLQPGPMARTVDDVEIAFRVLADPTAAHHDPRIAPVAAGDSSTIDVGGLRIGIVTDDGFFPAAPAARRAVEEAGRGLTAAGAQVQPLALPDVPEAIRLYFHLITADGAANLTRTLGGDRPDWRIRRLLRLGRMRRPARRVVVSLLRAAGHRRLAELIAASGTTSTDLYWQRTSERGETIRHFTRALDAERIDAIVMPPHALPALRHASAIDLNPAASYAFLPNLLGMPAGVVPATRVRASEETDRPLSRDLTDRAARRVELGSAGLPIGVQVVGRHWREDVVLAVMRALERHFHRQVDFPACPPI